VKRAALNDSPNVHSATPISTRSLSRNFPGCTDNMGMAEVAKALRFQRSEVAGQRRRQDPRPRARDLGYEVRFS
jgi:hypothetical protein